MNTINTIFTSSPRSTSKAVTSLGARLVLSWTSFFDHSCHKLPLIASIPTRNTRDLRPFFFSTTDILTECCLQTSVFWCRRRPPSPSCLLPLITFHQGKNKALAGYSPHWSRLLLTSQWLAMRLVILWHQIRGGALMTALRGLPPIGPDALHAAPSSRLVDPVIFVLTRFEFILSEPSRSSEGRKTGIIYR